MKFDSHYFNDWNAQQFNPERAKCSLKGVKFLSVWAALAINSLRFPPQTILRIFFCLLFFMLDKCVKYLHAIHIHPLSMLGWFYSINLKYIYLTAMDFFCEYSTERASQGLFYWKKNFFFGGLVCVRFFIHQLIPMLCLWQFLNLYLRKAPKPCMINTLYAEQSDA